MSNCYRFACETPGTAAVAAVAAVAAGAAVAVVAVVPAAYRISPCRYSLKIPADQAQNGVRMVQKILAAQAAIHVLPAVPEAWRRRSGCRTGERDPRQFSRDVLGWPVLNSSLLEHKKH